MSILRFNDGESFDTSGPFRKEERYDGWYVLGEGYLKPMRDEKACDDFLERNKKVKADINNPL